MKNQLSKIRLGILGGGQLAKMLALKSHEMGIQPYILSANAQDPAVVVSPYFTQGRLNSKKDLKSFLKKTDLVIFENEFVDMVLLSSLSAQLKAPVHPKPKIMNLLQDRLKQKKLFKKYSIPTANFIAVESQKQIQDLSNMFPEKVVFKKRLQGYDGGGILIVQDVTQTQKIKQFTNKKTKWIAEEYIRFKKELAIILVRNRKKQIVELPLVETYQKNACCLWVKGPCQHEQKDSLVKKLKTMMDKIDYEGVMAFELFDTKEGTLLVNELAPRVHNSGHYSLDALSEDQFSLHIKAVLNLDIKTPKKCSGGFAMLNLLGEKKPTKWLPPAGTKLYWYGKKESRPGRKMGHINNLDSSPNKALTTLVDFLDNMKNKRPA